MSINTEDLKSQIPLIDYVKKYYHDRIEIEHETNNACYLKCLWHEETNGSLVLYSNGTYKCFGCGEHGDIITFVEKMESVDFLKACEIISNNVGYKIEINKQKDNPYWDEYKEKITKHALRYYNNLKSNNEVLEYLYKRGITNNTIDDFKIGLTDKDEYKYRSDIGNISNKLTFPIQEYKKTNYKSVGIGYRTLIDERPKYINDHNQNGKSNQDGNLKGVFIKGDMLYGYPLAYDAIRRDDMVILVEGYMDVISMHQSNIKNTLGVLGCNISSKQLTIISNLTKNIVLLFDGDKAGRNAMLNQIKELYKNNLNVVVCLLDNIDPADLCLNNNFNTNIIKETIKDNALNGMAYFINTKTQKYENIVSIEMNNVVKSVMPVINAIPDEDLKQMYKTQFYKKIGLK